MMKLIILLSSILSLIITPGLANTNFIHAQRSPADAANDIINEIISVIGLKANFQVKAANIPNAAAVAYQGTRFILYNPSFFQKLDQAAGNSWASISVLAHEIGHHLNGHTMENIGSNPENELEADEFSGFVLWRMGATLEQAQIAMKIGASYKSSVTHPGKEARLLAIADGWQNAESQMTGARDLAKNRGRAVVPTPVERQQSVTREPALSDNQIIGDVQFNGENDAAYFITKKLNLVKVQDNEVYLVGKLASINNATFPYMIYDDNKNLLLVDTRGNIFSKSGRSVGSHVR